MRWLDDACPEQFGPELTAEGLEPSVNKNSEYIDKTNVNILAINFFFLLFFIYIEYIYYYIYHHFNNRFI